MASPHWLTPSGKSSTPAVVVSFDTETRPEVREGVEVLTLRCWDAVIRCRGAAAKHGDHAIAKSGETAAELANVLEAAVGVTGEAWAFAHNVGFDLTVTSLPMVMAARGWEPQFVNIGDESCVFVLKSEMGKLVITDAWSWLRCSLETAAKLAGMRKVKLPLDDDSLAAWHHRCAHDVGILDRLLADLLDWWDREDVGKFAVTGASCGWRTLRAHITPKTVLVGSEAERTDFEREAIFGGRREVFQVGRFRGRWVEDWDLATAYLTVAANMPLPVKPVRVENVSPPPSPLLAPVGLGAVVRVRIHTQTPCAPCRVAGDVWWPVGCFETVLTTVELAEVVKVADRVDVLAEQWYRLSDALQQWGRWCLDLQAQPDDIVPAVVKRVAKAWGRSVTGRFALKTSTLIGERTATHLGWALEAGYDLDTGDALETITYGGTERTYRKDQDGADVSPVVLAFVEGYVRAAMARTLAGRDPSLVLQCNTDGWWEVRAGRHSADLTDVVPRPFTAVRKAVSRDVTVMGPNHTDSRDDRRLAGVPKDAKRNLNGSYAWQDWPGLRWQLQYSRPGEYIRPGREMTLADHYCRRWVLTTGETVPVSVTQVPGGPPLIRGWAETPGRRPGDVLAKHQVPALAVLAGTDAPMPAPSPPGPWPALGRRSPPPSGV
jgi:hypothetical protein